MLGFMFLAILMIVIAKIIDLILLHHAYSIARELGENPPESAFILGFVQDYFWQRIFEISDDKQSKLLQRYLFYHKMMIMMMVSGAAALFMMIAMQYSTR